MKYNCALEIAEKLTFAKNKTLEEKASHKLIVTLIEAYKTKNYLMDEVTPNEILQHLREFKGISQTDLVDVIASSSVVSEIMNGKQSISQVQAKALGEYFKVLPSLFIDR